MTTIYYLLSDLILVILDNGRWPQLFSGAVKLADQFFFHGLQHGSYIGVPLEIWSENEFEYTLRKEGSLMMKPIFVTYGNYGSGR